MTNDEINETLQRIFPGDPVPDVSEDTHWSDEPRQTVSWRVSAPATIRHREPKRVRVSRDVVPRETAEKFARVMADLPAAPSVPARQYLLESPENVARWLDEAHDIESDVKLGQPAESHRVTRLMLEAIPIVESWKKEG